MVKRVLIALGQAFSRHRRQSELFRRIGTIPRHVNEVTLGDFARDAAQLTGQRSQGNVVPVDIAGLVVPQFRDVVVDRVIEAYIAHLVLLEDSKHSKGLGDASDAVQGVAVYRGDIWS